MARGRFINKTISYSAKFAQLPDDTSRLIATWMIPHLDKRGVFYADAAMIKGLVLPMSCTTHEHINDAVEAMVKVGLAYRFTGAGHEWLCWPGFADNQQGLRPDRETTEYPEPKPEVMTTGFPRADVGVNPRELAEDENKRGGNPAEGEVKDKDKGEVEGEGQESPARKTIPQSPAIKTYIAVTGNWKINDDQKRAIAEAVTDIPLWEKTITAWRVSGWKDANVQGMLDVYKKGGVTSNAISSSNWPRGRGGGGKVLRSDMQCQDATEEQRAAAIARSKIRNAERAARKGVAS